HQVAREATVFTVDVDDVDAARVLLDADRALPWQIRHVIEDHAIGAAVRDDQQRPPTRIAHECVECGQYAAAELDERLAAEKSAVGLLAGGPRVGHVRNPRLHVGDLSAALAAAYFFECRHDFEPRMRAAREDEACGRHSAGEAGTHGAIELDV